jgi:hypothetical protein
MTRTVGLAWSERSWSSGQYIQQRLTVSVPALYTVTPRTAQHLFFNDPTY